MNATLATPLVSRRNRGAKPRDASGTFTCRCFAAILNVNIRSSSRKPVSEASAIRDPAKKRRRYKILCLRRIFAGSRLGLFFTLRIAGCLAQYFHLVRIPDADCRCRAIRPGNQPLVIQLLLRASLLGPSLRCRSMMAVTPGADAAFRGPCCRFLGRREAIMAGQPFQCQLQDDAA